MLGAVTNERMHLGKVLQVVFAITFAGHLQ